MKRVVVTSTNRGKVREIRTVLESLVGWEIEPLPDGALPVEETGTTFLENAVHKAKTYGRRFGTWTLADDSGLEVDALAGDPGIHSARYAPTDAERVDKLLMALDGIGIGNRGARFVCALALARNGHVIWTVEEAIKGRIARTPRGAEGFGYDPVFWIPRLKRTMAELDLEEKNRISHRGRALARLRTFLEGLE